MPGKTNTEVIAQQESGSKLGVVSAGFTDKNNNDGFSGKKNNTESVDSLTKENGIQLQLSASPAKSNVINPYLKVKPKIPVIVDAKMLKRRQFAEKYRVQALHHNRKQRGGPVSPASALGLINRTRQWRDSWSCNSATGHILKRIPLRPRLFLFRSHEYIKPPRYSVPQTDRSMEYQQQEEGIWELNTGITELAGCAGSGKTQASLSLCATCVLTPLRFPSLDNVDLATSPGTNVHHYKAIYVSMGEGCSNTLLAVRLEKMLRARLKRGDLTEILHRIGLLSLRNEEDFVEFVEHDLPRFLASQNQHTHQQQPSKIGLIVFDGIAGFFRFSDPLFQHSRNSNSMFHRQRSSKLLQVSSQLRKLSDHYDVPILITNQVTACIPAIAGSSSSTPMLPSTQERVLPALGLSWSNCVSTRIILQRTNRLTAIMPDESVSHANKNIPKEAEEKSKNQYDKVLGVRKARVLQSVNMPKVREVCYFIDTGQVAAVSGRIT